ncbi:MAG: HEAT repeat domain-containing protein [Elusimicrobia bacterium]|nr:HEAT repeat domain-containing protein [Elusimicrobiota bacterium]
MPLHAQDPAQTLLDEALAKIRASRSDLSIRADRYETRMKLTFVESLLEDPTGASEKLKAVSDSLSASSTSAGLFRTGAELLGGAVGRQGPGACKIAIAAPEWSDELRDTLASLSESMCSARLKLENSVSSLTPEERRRSLDLVLAYVTNGAPWPSPTDFDMMSRFDLPSLLSAASAVAEATDRALPVLAAQAAKLGPPQPRSEFHDILVSWNEEEAFIEEDLQGVALLIHFGKKSRYLAPPAAAKEGEIRVVIDFAEDVKVETASGPASGVFGIGLLYLPNPKGLKTLAAGDVSLGAGLFGAGGLICEGPVDLQGGRFTQGAGAFGLGVLSTRGAGSRYALCLSGQGFGFTRGFGLLLHRGDRARFDGGRIEPDPREPLAALSLSQGAGYGPRAHAAGGVGLALIEGSGCELEASYMAQGQGYWRSLGALFLRGDRNRLQARRYVQGAGVHTAFGALQLVGNGNHLVSWGAGPALGWDYGVGLLAAEGDGNAFTAEWAAGRGDVNGHGLLLLQGARNRIALAEAGSGALKRGAPSFGIAVVSGKENRSSVSAAGDPWGILDGEDLILEPLASEKAEWPEVDRAAAFQRERKRLESLLASAQMRDWLHAAASASFDGETALRAAERLATLPQEESALLSRLVSPDAFDELLWLGILLPAYGRSQAQALLEEASTAASMRRAVLLGLLRFMPFSVAQGPLLPALDASEWQVRRAAAAAFEFLLDQRQGQEPGRLVLLRTALELCSSTSADNSWIERLGEQRLGALYSVLSLEEGMAPAERVSLLRATPRLLEPVGRETLQEFERILRARPAQYKDAIAAELRETSEGSGRALASLRKRLEDPDLDVVQAALAALSAAGEAEYAEALAQFLEHPKALLRETAAAGLGRMGKASEKVLKRALASPSPRTRALAAVGASQASDPGVFALLRRAFEDRNEEVRRTALAGLLAVQAPLRPERKRFIEDLRLLQEGDPSPSVRLAARRALVAIHP